MLRASDRSKTRKASNVIALVEPGAVTSVVETSRVRNRTRSGTRSPLLSLPLLRAGQGTAAGVGHSRAWQSFPSG
jgi:hypothetical protein